MCAGPGQLTWYSDADVMVWETRRPLKRLVMPSNYVANSDIRASCATNDTDVASALAVAEHGTATSTAMDLTCQFHTLHAARRFREQ